MLNQRNFDVPAEGLPLTSAQRGIAAACLVDPTSNDYVVGEFLRLSTTTTTQMGQSCSDVSAPADNINSYETPAPGINHDKLRLAVKHVLRETPWLNLSLHGDADTGRLRIGHAAVVLDHPEDSLSGSDASQRWAHALKIARADVAKPLCLSKDRLTTARVFALSDTEAAVSLTVHHLLLDGYGVHLVLRRILRTYLFLIGKSLPPLPWGDPSAVVTEENAYERSADAEADHSYWATHPPKPGATHSFNLPRSSDQTSSVAEAGSPTTIRCRPDFDLDIIAAAHNCSTTDLLLAAHAIVLSRWSGSRDVIIGIPLMNRLGSAAAQAPTCTVNVLPVAVHVTPTTSTASFLHDVSTQLSKLRAHSRFRSESLLSLHGHLAAGTQPTGTELNIKVFGSLPHTPGLQASIEPIAEGPLDDVSISVLFDGTGIAFSFTAPTGTSSDSVSELALEFTQILESFAAPGDRPLGQLGAEKLGPSGSVSARKKATATQSIAIASKLPPVPLLHTRLVTAGRQHPQRAAIVHSQSTWTHAQLYTEILKRTAALAAHTALGQVIILDLPRSNDAVAWYLAASAAGRPAAPIDHGWPETRRRDLTAHLAETAEATSSPPPVRLTPELSLAWREANQPTSEEATEPTAATAESTTIAWEKIALAEWKRVHGASPAYIIHTSGSTGRPKPVIVGQAALGRHLHNIGSAMWASGKHHAAALTLPLMFDGSWDMLSAVVWGHTVVLVDRDIAIDPRACTAAVQAHRATAIDTTPTMLAALLEENLLVDSHNLTHINVGGEACPQHLWDQIAHAITAEGQQIQATNYYGPTESTVDATRVCSTEPQDRAVVDSVRQDPGSLIGRGLEGTSIFVLDQWLRPVPLGVRGELWLSGPQLAHGYWGLPGLSAERFVANPFGPVGSRMYRTGDLVRMLPGGYLLYEGRVDDQIKVRGYRIEPREIESCLERLPEIRQALVRLIDTQLIAWVITENSELEGAELRNLAAEHLPEHFLPAAIVPLPSFPRTTTGKIDLTLLPSPQMTTCGRAPEGSAELAVAAAFNAVLHTSNPRADADFFRLGGDSITAIRLVSILRNEGYSTSVSKVFTHRTLARIATTCTPVNPHNDLKPILQGELPAADPAAVDAVTALLQSRLQPPKGLEH